MGTVFFNMLVGEKPRKGELLVAIVQQHRTCPESRYDAAICNFSEPDDVPKSEAQFFGGCLAGVLGDLQVLT